MNDLAPHISARLLDPRGGCSVCRRASIGWSGSSFTAVDDLAAGHPADSGSFFAMPPLANAHDHVRGVRPTALGAYDLPLELATAPGAMAAAGA